MRVIVGSYSSPLDACCSLQISVFCASSDERGTSLNGALNLLSAMLVDFVRSIVSRKRTYQVSGDSLFEDAAGTHQPPSKRAYETSAVVSNTQMEQSQTVPKRGVCVRCANGEPGHITHIMGC